MSQLGMPKLLLLVAVAVHLSVYTRAAQVTSGDLKSLNAISNEKVDRIALHTPYGRIVVKLLSDNAPRAAAAVRQHAISKGCKDCNFYRAEARPSQEKHQPKEGPPYALLQGSMNLREIPGSEGDIEVKAGHVAFIPNTSDFFIALGDHPEWGKAHTVFGVIEDWVSTDLIAIQPYHEHKHEEYGTVMRMMDVPVSFSVSTDVYSF
ncbi:hypothetical protein Ndes2526A_g01220 [Nannochloris sp. 'desiccata']